MQSDHRTRELYRLRSDPQCRSRSDSLATAIYIKSSIKKCQILTTKGFQEKGFGKLFNQTTKI